MKKVIVIMIEGFSYNNISAKNTPCIAKLAKNGKKFLLKPMFAFRGIEATIFTGLNPLEHGIWTEFQLKTHKKSTKHSKHSIIKNKILKVLDIFFIDKIRRNIRFIFQKILQREIVQMTHLIPTEGINFFEPSLKNKIWFKNVLKPHPTLFDIFRELNQSFAYIEPNMVRDFDPIKNLKNIINSNKCPPFIYLKLSIPDNIGHKYGLNSKEMQKCLQKIDVTISKLTKLLNNCSGEKIIAIFSAHGMVQVKGRINLEKKLKSINAKPFRDYVSFLDSTMARFWFLNRDAKKEIIDLLQNIKHGHILSELELVTLEVPKDLKNGELIFCLDEGYIIHPCYFHKTDVPKGMHGYAYSKSLDSYSPFILYGSEELNLPKILTFSEIFTVLLKLQKLNIKLKKYKKDN